jgi:Grx4 family monothiol glutaredoxin
MGIINRIKKRLPIVGSGSSGRPIQATPPRPRPAPYTAAPEEEEVLPESPRGDRDPREWIAEVVAENPIVLFMKGSPSMPQCGFSANASAILRGYQKPFFHVDVLADPEVREGVKQFSSWPTIPQIYIGGEFVGGSDILQQMANNGELDEAIGEAFSKAAAAPAPAEEPAPAE